MVDDKNGAEIFTIAGKGYFEDAVKTFEKQIKGLLVDMAEEVSVFLSSNRLFSLYITKNMSPSPQSGPQKYYGTFSEGEI